MDRYKVFTLDPVNFPLNKMRELVHYLHEHDQHFVLMVDPGQFHSHQCSELPLTITTGVAYQVSFLQNICWLPPSANQFQGLRYL